MWNFVRFVIVAQAWLCQVNILLFPRWDTASTRGTKKYRAIVPLYSIASTLIHYRTMTRCTKKYRVTVLQYHWYAPLCSWASTLTELSNKILLFQFFFWCQKEKGKYIFFQREVVFERCGNGIEPVLLLINSESSPLKLANGCGLEILFRDLRSEKISENIRISSKCFSV